MAVCDECGKTMYPRQRKCSCGWIRKDAREASTGICEVPGCPQPGTLSRNTFGEGGWRCSFHFWGSHTKNTDSKMLERSRVTREEIDKFVAEYQRAHPSSSKREACLRWLQDRNLLSLLPENLREAEEERKAIQQENDSGNE